MADIIGIRRENKNIWERRVPITPNYVKMLNEHFNIETILQPFEKRAISDKEYLNCGAAIKENLSDCSTIFAVKEVPQKELLPNKKYIFFSHTIKGQEYNMPMLQRMMDLKCTLIDYECIREKSGRRLVFFGKYAGIAGMIETFHVLGKRLKSMKIDNPFEEIKPAYEYEDVNEAKEHINNIASNIKDFEFPDEMNPFVFGFVGYGNVSKGAQDIFDLIPHTEIEPIRLINNDLKKGIYKVVFKEIDIVKTKNSFNEFDLFDYFNHPENYSADFEKYLDKVDVLINAIYWDEPYPRILTKELVKKHADKLKIKLVNDISCDINGAIEFTEKVMEPDLPCYVYNPIKDKIVDGYDTEGILNIAIDNLPTEVPKDSSYSFADKIYPFVYNIVKTETDVPFEECGFMPEIKNAVILYNGELTPSYKYIEKFMK